MEAKSLEQQQALENVGRKITALEKIKSQIESEAAALSMVAEPKTAYLAPSETEPAKEPSKF